MLWKFLKEVSPSLVTVFRVINVDLLSGLLQVKHSKAFQHVYVWETPFQVVQQSIGVWSQRLERMRKMNVKCIDMIKKIKIFQFKINFWGSIFPYLSLEGFPLLICEIDPHIQHLWVVQELLQFFFMAVGWSLKRERVCLKLKLTQLDQIVLKVINACICSIMVFFILLFKTINTSALMENNMLLFWKTYCLIPRCPCTKCMRHRVAMNENFCMKMQRPQAMGSALYWSSMCHSTPGVSATNDILG